MSVKIQINSLKALERLIGGDTELELELRRSICHEFAKKHLKPIAETEAFKEATARLTHGIEFAIAEEVSKELTIVNKVHSGKYYELRPAIVKEIHKEVDINLGILINKRLRDVVDDEFNKAMAKLDMKKFKDELMSRAIQEAKRQIKEML